MHEVVTNWNLLRDFS